MTTITTFALTLGVFGLIALAAKNIGAFATQIRLPKITGYLFAGMIAGPFVLKVISTEGVHSLLFIDEISLAVIAFLAGSEIYLKELRSDVKSIAWSTAMQLIFIFTLAVIAMWLLSDFLPFTQGQSSGFRLATALIAGTILLTRSPSSVIAVINELRAKGTFTRITLGVTVIMDVVIIILFSVSTSIADAIFNGAGIEVGFIFILALELLLSVFGAWLLSLTIQQLLKLKAHKLVKIGAILLVGYSVFFGAHELRDFTHELMATEIFLEPLLICMLASFHITNFTSYRQSFGKLLHDISPLIYIAFFTLTGASLDLGVMAQTWPIALALFAVRLIGIYFGSVSGSLLAGKDRKFAMTSWMGYITQAGVALGLAKAVADQFPQLGTSFASMIISVIVINEIVGPLFLKAGIRRMGESGLPGEATPDNIRDVVIFGENGDSLTLGSLLQRQNWEVTRIDAKGLIEHMTPHRHPPEDTEEHYITSSTDAVVAMLLDDDLNLRIVKKAYKVGVERIVVRVCDTARRSEFRDLGAWVIDAEQSIISLLDQFVRSPYTAARLLYDPERGMVQIKVMDENIIGIAIKDLRLPDDALLLSLYRNGKSLVPNGNTVLKLDDEVTVVGSPESVDMVTLKLGI